MKHGADGQTKTQMLLAAADSRNENVPTTKHAENKSRELQNFSQKAIFKKTY